MTAKRAMQAAQRLYENGLITYMRTDSVVLSTAGREGRARPGDARATARSICPKTPRLWESKSRNAQEAHEAIRPAGETFRTPDEIACEVGGSTRRRLYDLIWKRTVASQMLDARLKTPDRDLRLRGRGRREGRARGARRASCSSTASCAPTSRAPTSRRRAPRRKERPKRRRRCCPRFARATTLGWPRPKPSRAPDEAARALHGSGPRAAARGAGHRPAVDLRQHHRHDHRPRVRGEAGQRARAHPARLRRRAADDRSWSRPSSTTRSPPRWRGSSTRSRTAT